VSESNSKQREWIAWAYVGAWSLGIFLAIPLARTVEGVVRDHAGQAAFGWFVLGVVVVATGEALRRALARSRAEGTPLLAGAVWLCGVAAVFIAATASLWSNPEEAMHFVQYGVLGLLLHRALRQCLADCSVYVVAALIGTSVGCIDEAIQWVTPGRYFGLRDIIINALASSLVQVAIAKGLRPLGVEPAFRADGIRTSCAAAAGLLCLLMLFALNTPARTARWAGAVPGLEFLAHNESTMMEYGYRYDVAGIGRFRSRLELDELTQVDATRGAAVADQLATCLSDYRAFILAVPPSRDAFLHELCVHLFRRDRYRFLANRTSADDLLERRKLTTVAVREERLVRAYFGRALSASGLAFTPAGFERLVADELPELEYESTVSRALVTEVRERELLGFLGLGLVALGFVDRQRHRLTGAQHRATARLS
jgi:hypothetical protein